MPRGGQRFNFTRHGIRQLVESVTKTHLLPEGALSRTPLRLCFDLDQEIEAAFADLIHQSWGRAEAPRGWQPAVDLTETDEAYFLEADLPGVSRDSIELRVEDSRVLLRGHRRSVRVSQSERGVRIERAQGEFERAFTLDQPVDPERVEVSCEQGILRVRLPKRT